MAFDLWSLYAQMLRSRRFEEAVARLWQDGLITGEMHLGTGEEAIVAGVVSQLRDGDAMALDHRGSAALLMRGVDPVLILRELLGCSDGLCGGMGGHMHLFSKAHLAAASGVVGAAGPAAVGFALSAQVLRPGAVAVAFFGEGAVNQGMLMESLHLAAAWSLPVIFVCKDDGWAITTRSPGTTAGDLAGRARGLGVRAVSLDGYDVAAAWEAAGSAIREARSGHGPTFLHARCVHLEGHFLGDELVRVTRNPLSELPKMMFPLVRSFLHPRGAGLRERLAGMAVASEMLLAAWRDPRRNPAHDPLERARAMLRSDPIRLREVEDQVMAEINRVVEDAMPGARP